LTVNKEVDRLYKKEFPESYERDKQLERDALQWKKFLEKDQGKVKFPKTIFEIVESAFTDY
jgi:hypothetical protein